MNIYVSRDGQTFGPYSPEQAHAMIAQGQLFAGDLACPEGANQWVALGQVLGIPPGPPPAVSAPLAPAARPTIPLALPASSIHPPPHAMGAPPPPHNSGGTAAHFAIQHSYRAASGAFSALGVAAALGGLGLGLPAVAWAAERAPGTAITDFFGQTLGLKTAAIVGLSLAVICICWFFVQRRKAVSAKNRFEAMIHAGL
jgi:hypothetical protein